MKFIPFTLQFNYSSSNFHFLQLIRFFPKGTSLHFTYSFLLMPFKSSYRNSRHLIPTFTSPHFFHSIYVTPFSALPFIHSI